MDEVSSNISKTVWSINSVTTILVFWLTFCLVFISTRRRHGVPPGPPLWPIIGNIPSLMSRDVLGRLRNLRKKYGEIYGLYIGSELNIFLNGYDVIHDALVKHGTLFSRRPVTGWVRLFVADNTAIAFANGESWKKFRNFALGGIRDIYFSDKGRLVGTRISEEIAFFVKEIETSAQPIEPSWLVNLSFANVMFNLIHGRRIGYNNKDFNWFLEFSDQQFKNVIWYQVLFGCFPFLDNIPKQFIGVTERNSTFFRSHYSKMFVENFKTYTKGSLDSLADWYLTNILKESNGNETKPINEYFDDDMWLFFHDLQAAGSETSATTLKWIMLHLCLNQEVQQKLQAEIDSKLSPNATVSLSNREELPYVHATILEGLRIGTTAPLAIPHGVNEDTIFRGHFIQKDVQVIVNISSVLKDPDIFPDPETFKPERFLSEDLKEVVIPKEFIPFSLGPRSCIGETLAKMELFLYTTTLLHKFDLKLATSSITPSTVGVLGLTYHPDRFKINFIKRN